LKKLSLNVLLKNKLKDNHHEKRISIDNINKTTINIKIKETKNLIKNTKHPVFKRQLEIDLKSYLAIKNLFDMNE
jgi:hypothetical protein